MCRSGMTENGGGRGSRDEGPASPERPQGA